MLVTLDDIRAAATRIRGVARRTPVLEIDLTARGRGARRGGSSAFAAATADRRSSESGGWSDPPGDLTLKCENLQPSGAFKLRGACNMVAQLQPAARAAGVITYSSGNHGQAVAMVARLFSIPAVVVMPETAPQVKVEGITQLGGEVIIAGRTSADRKARAEELVAQRGLTMVPPFDHPWIIAGAGTVGLEILEQCPRATTVFVPMGGGGQISGVSAAVKGMRGGVRVIGVEPADAARMSASLAAEHPVTLDRATSIADGLLTLRPGDLTFAHVRAFVDEVVTVTDAEMIDAVRWLFHEAHLVAEPSGAAATAAALRAGIHGAVAVVSGGNVDPVAYAGYISPAG
ncbi:MAG TPA: threonine/serine dehydratase [Vicinamibacterales bacterium]|nr:threonine/serine dehydratase [Vicinamibacterales bacterium]